MLAHLLAAHPDTTAETLTHLAGTPGLSAATRLALLTHPRLTDLTRLETATAAELHGALTRASPSRRAAILRAAHSPRPYTALWIYIRRYAGLTTTEIRDAVNAHPSVLTTHPCALALARNPNTPSNFATRAIDHLLTDPSTTTSFRQQMTIIDAAARHHYDLDRLAQTLTDAHPTDTRLAEHLAAYLTARRTRPLTYAQHLLAALPRDPALWGDAIKATSDPQLAAHALSCPALLPAARLIGEDPHLAHLHPQAVLARLTERTSRTISDVTPHIETADPTTTHAAIDYIATHAATNKTLHPQHARVLTDLLRRAASNPTTRPDTLTLIADHLHPDHTVNLDYALLAAHPNAPAALRTRSLRAAGAGAHPVQAALITISHHLATADPRPARDASVAALTFGGTSAAVLLHHARPTAYTHTHWPCTHTGELALLSLTPGFTGTLDQLLTTAHAVSR